ncbi:MAG: hypothetical protein JNK76_10280, partial [Planctomycetales bacterium]|nr:hypothetical protein [Planctomycetales bacterium]
MIATHQGLQSLGRVLTIGVSTCLFTSLIMLPALLTWLSEGRVDTTDADETFETKFPAEDDDERIRRREARPHPGNDRLPAPVRRPQTSRTAA